MKESLSEHIKGAIKEYGSDIIKDGRIISILADYNAYKDNQVYQGMLKTWRDNQAMLEKLYVTLINKDDLELDNLKNYMVNTLGQDKSRVDYLVECFKYGVGMSKKPPIYSSTYNITDDQGESSQTTSKGTTKSGLTILQSILGNGSRSSLQSGSASNSVSIQTNGNLPNSSYGGSQPSSGNGVRYVDLGLSVLWADRNYQASTPQDIGTEMVFYKARNNVNVKLPTQSEAKELIDKCSFIELQNYIYKVVGPNGNSIMMPFAEYWTSGNDSDSEREVVTYELSWAGSDLSSNVKAESLAVRSIKREAKWKRAISASPLITGIVLMACCGILLDCFFTFPLWVEILYFLIGFALVWCVKNKDFEALQNAIKS